MSKYLTNVRHITQAGAYDSQPDPEGLDKLPDGPVPSLCGPREKSLQVYAPSP